jgi:hypothetical protein
MTTSQPPWEFMALAALVVVTAGWVNWAWARGLMFKVLDVVIPRNATWLRERVRPGQVFHVVLLAAVLMWIWMRYRGDLHALVVLLEVAGITLLAAEVWAAQELETIDQDISQLKPQIVPAAVNRWEETKIRTAAWRRRRLWAGAGLLISAALLGMFEAKEEVPPPADDEVKVGLRLHPGRRLPSFVPGSAELTPEMRSAICHYRATPAEWGSAVAIVVGRHDKTELSASTRAQFSSNASLAEQRGLAIQVALKDPHLCGPGQAVGEMSILQLDSPPRHVGSRVSREQLAEDRGAELYLLTATARRVPSGGGSSR